MYYFSNKVANFHYLLQWFRSCWGKLKSLASIMSGFKTFHLVAWLILFSRQRLGSYLCYSKVLQKRENMHSFLDKSILKVYKIQ